MEEVVTSIKRVNDIMSEIAAASSEQASGIEEVSKAVVQMDEMTQQNAALVEEAAAAAESLQQQSSHLSERVSAFTIKDLVRGEQSVSPKLASPKPVSNAQKKSQRVMPKPQKKLSPKVPHSEEWESF